MQGNTLVIGIGNDSRGDDGLGWAFVDHFEKKGLPGLTFELRYQLQIEDATLIEAFDTVVFVDATESSIPRGCALEPCLPEASAGLFTHQLRPQQLLHIRESLGLTLPQCHLLSIQGYSWELGTPISPEGAQNLRAAIQLFEESWS